MIETTINNVDAIVLIFVQGAFGSFSPIVSILWRLMFVVFIALFGYKVIISGNFSASNLFVNTIKIILILVVATQWDQFSLIVYNLATDLPDDIAGVLISSVDGATPSSGATDEASANSTLSLFHDRAMEVTSNTLKGAGWSEIGLYFYGFIIWFGSLAFTGYAAMLIILAKMAVAILLAVAPLFILLLIYSNSKSLFDGWLRTLLNYAIIPIFVYAVLALMLSLADIPLSHLETMGGVKEGFLTLLSSFLFICVVAVLLLSQIMNIAASVTGGLSLSTMGAGAWAARKAGGHAKSATKHGGKGVYKGTGAAKQKIQDAIKRRRIVQS